MGRNKALLPLPSNTAETFVEHLAALLLAQCSEVLLVAQDMQQASLYRDTGLSLVTDEVPEYGPLMGLYSGLRAIQAPHALVVAVDMPFVLPEIIAFLLSQPLDEHILVPVVDNVPQVLCALYPRSLLSLIEERLQAGRRDPRSLLDSAPVRFLDEAQLRTIDPQLRSFTNVNTPEEYRGSYEKLGQD
jgi:molybdopterin-guanine dinucleotide biosynthesis protein A